MNNDSAQSELENTGQIQDLVQREGERGGLSGQGWVLTVRVLPARAEQEHNPIWIDSPGASHVTACSVRPSNIRQSSLLRFSQTPSSIPSSSPTAAYFDRDYPDPEASSSPSAFRSHSYRRRSSSNPNTPSEGLPSTNTPILRRVTSTSTLSFQRSSDYPVASFRPPFSSTPPRFSPIIDSATLPSSTTSILAATATSTPHQEPPPAIQQ